MAEAADAGRRAGPGDRLRSARERRGLSVRDAAAHLRLDPAVITALEADDYAALPAPIFVKGYLGAYARLLGIPADECVAEYTAAVDGAPPPPLVVRRGTGDGFEGSASSRVSLVSWLVALVAIAMVVLWWYAPQGFGPTTTVSDEPRPVPVPVTVPEPEADRAPGPDADAAVDAPAEPVADTVLERVPEPAVATITARFSYREASWTEIVDADGDRLYFDLARAGSVVEVSGTPPLSVFLGNSPAVDIVVDGRPFDQSRYDRAGNVARFRLGAQ